MYFYLFPALAQDPVLAALTQFKETPTVDEYFKAFPALLRFSVEEAITENSVREYIISKMLEASTLSRSLELPDIEIYLAKDIQGLYDLAFGTDWNWLCKKAGTLPFPSGTRENEVHSLTEYSDFIRTMTKAGSSEELAEQLICFFKQYANADEAQYSAFRWEDGEMLGIDKMDSIVFDRLGGLETQKATLIENTQAFLKGKPANNVLLVGGSGTGKSSCVKANLNYFADKGLRMVEISKQELATLPALMEELRVKKQHYIIYIDDLSFEDADQSYIELKVALDGQLEPKPAHVLIYATSNRRRLMRESWTDRQGVDDLHTHDALHEKMSLSERFGIRLYFGVLSQQEYFGIIEMLLNEHGVEFTDELGIQAATWASTNNGRSGRTARQFTNHYLAQVL